MKGQFKMTTEHEKYTTFEKWQYILEKGYNFTINKINNDNVIDPFVITLSKNKEKANFSGYSITDAVNDAYKFVRKEIEYARLCTHCKKELNSLTKKVGIEL